MITGLYAGILGLLFFKLSVDTIRGRRTHKISLGTGPQNEILPLVSAHSNFSGYVPLLLILLYIAEEAKLSAYLIHAFGISITLGRVFHYLAMKEGGNAFKKRVTGMMLTLWPLIILSVMSVGIYFRSLF